LISRSRIILFDTFILSYLIILLTQPHFLRFTSQVYSTTARACPCAFHSQGNFDIISRYIFVSCKNHPLSSFCTFIHLPIWYTTDLPFFFLHTANATSQTQVLGLLGLRRGLISKWLGHPHSALSGAVYISL
jgi:hypothetical protein